MIRFVPHRSTDGQLSLRRQSLWTFLLLHPTGGILSGPLKSKPTFIPNLLQLCQDLAGSDPSRHWGGMELSNTAASHMFHCSCLLTAPTHYSALCNLSAHAANLSPLRMLLSCAVVTLKHTQSCVCLYNMLFCSFIYRFICVYTMCLSYLIFVGLQPVIVSRGRRDEDDPDGPLR